MTLEEQIGEIIGSTINTTSNMDNTEGWDSLNHILVCDIVSKTFHIKLTFDEMIEIVSMEKIWKLLDRRGVHYETLV